MKSAVGGDGANVTANGFVVTVISELTNVGLGSNTGIVLSTVDIESDANSTVPYVPDTAVNGMRPIKHPGLPDPDVSSIFPEHINSFAFNTIVSYAYSGDVAGSDVDK